MSTGMVNDLTEKLDELEEFTRHMAVSAERDEVRKIVASTKAIIEE